MATGAVMTQHKALKGCSLVLNSTKKISRFANYFDYAASTPLLPEAKTAMEPYFSERFYNPSALYLGARTNRLALEASRATIARGLGAKPVEVIFTAGGTEANSLAIRGILEARPESKVLVSAIEHESVLAPAKLFDCQLLPVDKKGTVKLDVLEKAITDKVALISVMYANNEIGTIQPIREIAQIVKLVNKDRQNRGVKPLLFHTDACQAANYLDMQVNKLGVDLMTINSGKIYGPKQCGALYVKSGVRLKPLILGGGQEFGLRSGTVNLANVIGFTVAWELIRQDYQEEARRLSQLRDEFIEGVKGKVPSIVVNGPSGQNRLANNISLSFKNVDNERLVMVLDECGFQVASGSACSAASDEPSHVLRAVGLNKNLSRGTIRIALGRYSNGTSLKNLLQGLVKAVAKK